MNATVLIPAAGTGSRMGAGVNKQYLTLADRPILAHTLALFDGHPAIGDIYIISPREEIPFCRDEIVARYGFAKVRSVVPGGAERQDSVANGLAACAAGDREVVLVHDGVRPLFPATLIETVIATAERRGACLVGVPVKDTIKEVEGGLVRGTPERTCLWLAQTPQAFRVGLLRTAVAQARADGFRGTDDASLVERLGVPVAMVEGSYRNIKITTPEDLVLARALLAAAEEGQ
jgi:2-C-methyl-D-erythritol 4-phosphate cytidylyltransferase